MNIIKLYRNKVKKLLEEKKSDIKDDTLAKIFLEESKKGDFCKVSLSELQNYYQWIEMNVKHFGWSDIDDMLYRNDLPNSIEYQRATFPEIYEYKENQLEKWNLKVFRNYAMDFLKSPPCAYCRWGERGSLLQAKFAKNIGAICAAHLYMRQECEYVVSNKRLKKSWIKSGEELTVSHLRLFMEACKGMGKKETALEEIKVHVDYVWSRDDCIRGFYEVVCRDDIVAAKFLIEHAFKRIRLDSMLYPSFMLTAAIQQSPKCLAYLVKAFPNETSYLKDTLLILKQMEILIDSEDFKQYYAPIMAEIEAFIQ